jgi:EAL domain-containing protein (putative c-di-GMP-specific phosphodiesterase class I)
MQDDRLRLVAQPIVDLRTGEHIAEELLLRIVDRDGCVDLPGPFIQAAERYPLITEIDAWVLDRAACLASAGRPLHVNLSGRTFADPLFADLLEATLERRRADASLLTFEVTETATPVEQPSADVVAERIVKLGGRIAIDDFGTGYGSLSYLYRLPVSMIKIDRTFVRDIATNEYARAFVESIVRMAERLGLTTVAEGVTDDDALSALRECGADLAQGFHLGLPERI